MRNVIVVLLTGAALGLAVVAQERAGARPRGILKAGSQIDAELERSTPALGIVAGQTTEVVGTDAGRMVVRRRQAGPNNASVHDDVTEVYHVVSGAGTLVTGGAIADPEKRTAGITGGVAQRIEAGDFVVLPPGTPHWFSQIDGTITYVETRFAAGR